MKWTQKEGKCLHVGSSRSSRRLLLSVLVLVLGSAISYGVNAQESPTNSPSSWTVLKETLNEALKESQSLEQRLTRLQNDNARLLSLSSQQGESLRELSQAHVDLQSSLERLSQSLTISSEQAEYLEVSNRRNRMVWQIGLPAAIVVGILGGVWVAR